MQSLSNTQIQDQLYLEGFSMIAEKSYAFEFGNPAFPYPIYVKKSNKFPLVIHDSFLPSRDDLLNIQGVSADKDQVEYFNSNMRGFSSMVNPYKDPTPQKAEKFGLAFGFENDIALRKFLEQLSKVSDENSSTEDFMKKVNPVDVDDNFDESTTPSEKDVIIKARIGQGAYRKALLQYWKGCAVTSCKREELLISSHIVPWRIDKEARLDPFNGLLLAPTLDKAFDRGFISFNDDGSILLSSQLTTEDLKQLHLDSSLRLRGLDARHVPYLARHRSEIFKA